MGIHELGHFLTAKACGVRVEEFSVGMGPKLISRQHGETMYSLRLLPLGGYCMMEGEDEDSDDERSFSKAPVVSRILVVVAGAFNNVLLGFLILMILTATGGSITSRTVAQFYEGATTEQTGLQVDDKIVAVNGSKVFIANDIYYVLQYVEDGKADLTVIRDGEKIELNDVQFPLTTDEDGNQQISVDFMVYGVKKSVVTVFQATVLEVLSMIKEIFASIAMLITGAATVNELTGPIGIVSVISEAASYGIRNVVYFAAYLSINLGIMNMLPLPALDGGKFVVLLFELITKKKPGQKLEIIINAAGLVFLLGLMIFITYNDIVRLFF